MVKYQLLGRKSRVFSSRLCVSRRMKLIVVCGILTGSLGALFHTSQRSRNLAGIYALQASAGYVIDNEIANMPEINESEEAWRETSIRHGNLFSAYLDPRPEQIMQDSHPAPSDETTWATIRVIGIFSVETEDAPLTCVYKYRRKLDKGEDDKFEDAYATRRASRVKLIAPSENFGLRYGAFFVICSLSMPAGVGHEEIYVRQHLPYEVTIVPSNAADPSRWRNDSFVHVRYPESGLSMGEYPSGFMSVCVPVLHHNFNKPSSLVQFIEYYAMMGAERFTFYNSSIAPRVSRVLEHYRERGLVDVLQWNLPSYYVFEKTLRVDGIFAALNDCLYRSSFYRGYFYVAGVDIDEFIVPRMHDDFSRMMRHLDPTGPEGPIKQQASFVFRNIFFYLMFDDDPVTLRPELPRLHLQTKTTRRSEANEIGDRSKYIVRGRQAVELGNHHAWELRRTASGFQYAEVPVDVDVAASHHYRSCETNVEACWTRPTVVDRTAHRFAKALAERVAEACEKIFNDACPADGTGFKLTGKI